MKKFIKDYIKLISLALTGLVFILGSFYLIMNYNHSEELKKTIYITPNDYYYKKHQEILADLSENLIEFRNKKINNASYSTMYQSLSNCYNVLQSDGTLSKVIPNNSYTSLDVYNLGDTFQNTVINSCYVLNLSYLKTDDVPKEFKSISPFITSYVDSINLNIEDSLSEIQNNSSYFYSTNITSAAIRNYLRSDYKIIANSYNDFASILLYLSEYINNGGGQ